MCRASRGASNGIGERAFAATWTSFLEEDDLVALDAVALGDLDRDGVLDADVCDANTLYRSELAAGTQTAA